MNALTLATAAALAGAISVWADEPFTYDIDGSFEDATFAVRSDVGTVVAHKGYPDGVMQQIVAEPVGI